MRILPDVVLIRGRLWTLVSQLDRLNHFLILDRHHAPSFLYEPGYLLCAWINERDYEYNPQNWKVVHHGQATIYDKEGVPVHEFIYDIPAPSASPGDGV